jgi:hypothetical protein
LGAEKEKMEGDNQALSLFLSEGREMIIEGEKILLWQKQE